MTEQDLHPDRRSAIAERLKSIHLRDGVLKAEAVLEDARDPTSPCHEWFEWDLQRAASEYWIERARRLIRAIAYTVVVEDTVLTVPYYLRDPNQAEGEQGYTSVVDLLTDKDLARRALRNEVERAIAVIRRVEGYAQVLKLDPKVKPILRKLESLHQAVAN